MNSKFLIILASGLVIVIVIFVAVFRSINISSQTGVLPVSTHTSGVSMPTGSPSIEDDIRKELSEKYNKDTDVIEITVETITGEFAKGSVHFTDEFGGAIWFAARQEGKWVLAADGQGPMTCDVAEKYSFPGDLVPECIGQQGDLVVR